MKMAWRSLVLASLAVASLACSGNTATPNQGSGGHVQGASGGAPAGSGGASGGGAGTTGSGGSQAGSAGDKLDLLFLIDDSSSMTPLQAKLTTELPTALNPFAQNPVTGHATDLHVAVISSSMGGGAWNNVNQCRNRSFDPMTLGDFQGYFLDGKPSSDKPGSCGKLNAGETFLDTGDGKATGPNFTGDLNAAFGCMAQLGDRGCGFESPFGAIQAALTKAKLPRGMAPSGSFDNGGFLRPDARLAIVMLTNEDDCSVTSSSLLLDPEVNSSADPSGLGALTSYRCNEFGHLCDDPAGAAGSAKKVPPPHTVTTNVTLTGCVSAENDGKTDPEERDANGTADPSMGHLLTVASFVDFLKGLKSDPRDVYLAAIIAPPTPYVVVPKVNLAANGELDPVVDHSCTAMTADPDLPQYGDPAVRITQAVTAFGANGFTQGVCDPDYQAVLAKLAKAIHGG